MWSAGRTTTTRIVAAAAQTAASCAAVLVATPSILSTSSVTDGRGASGGRGGAGGRPSFSGGVALLLQICCADGRRRRAVGAVCRRGTTCRPPLSAPPGGVGVHVVMTKVTTLSFFFAERKNSCIKPPSHSRMMEQRKTMRASLPSLLLCPSRRQNSDCYGHTESAASRRGPRRGSVGELHPTVRNARPLRGGQARPRSTSAPVSMPQTTANTQWQRRLLTSIVV